MLVHAKDTIVLWEDIAINRLNIHVCYASKSDVLLLVKEYTNVDDKNYLPGMWLYVVCIHGMGWTRYGYIERFT